MNLEKLSLEDLYYYERLTKVICSIYENSVKNYDGSIRQNSDDLTKFDEYNKRYRMIVSEIEKRIQQL